MESNPTPLPSEIFDSPFGRIFDSPEGEAITAAMSANPFDNSTEESAARSAAWDLYLLNERDTLREGGWVPADAEALKGGAANYAYDFWMDFR